MFQEKGLLSTRYTERQYVDMNHNYVKHTIDVLVK